MNDKQELLIVAKIAQLIHKVEGEEALKEFFMMYKQYEMERISVDDLFGSDNNAKKNEETNRKNGENSQTNTGNE